MADIDTIVVGSGISGMTAGIILAKEGEKVLVLEQHTIPGGLTQTFKRAGTVFPTGVHRLGALAPGQPLWLYFNYLGLLDRLELRPMAREGFETYLFPGESVKVPQDRRVWKAALAERFPDQAEGLERYFMDMAAVTGGLDLFDPGCTGQDLSGEFTLSMADYFAGIGISGRLAGILGANNPLYGLPTDQCPVLIHFVVTEAYLASSYRINEAATPFSKAVADSFEAAGGRIRTGALVERFMIRDGTAEGVVLSGGETLRASKVIFSGHPARLPELCPPKTFRPVFEKRLASAENTPGLFGLCLKWEKKNCPVADNDAYIYGTWDVNAHYTQNQDDSSMIFLSALPENPDTRNTHLGVTALAGLGQQTRHRLAAAHDLPGKTAYRDLKAAVAEKLMARIEAVFPGSRDQAEIVDTYTPATFERYTLTPGGSAYGIRKTARAFLQTMFSPATRVKGLFLTGQSIGFCGIHGGISASVNLCRHFLPQGVLMEKIRNRGGLS